jgi:hypothetical protein
MSIIRSYISWDGSVSVVMLEIAPVFFSPLNLSLSTFVKLVRSMGLRDVLSRLFVTVEVTRHKMVLVCDG